MTGTTTGVIVDSITVLTGSVIVIISIGSILFVVVVVYNIV